MVRGAICAYSSPCTDISEKQIPQMLKKESELHIASRKNVYKNKVFPIN